jgi:hypothetical protein
MATPDTSHLLFVLGMHRSGTSALCAALQACGASFGSSLLDPMDGVNDEGFWEDSDVVAVNESLLAAADAQWYSPLPALLERDWLAAEFDSQREVARGILQRGFGPSPVAAVKDPRLCLTLPFWTALCEQQGMASSVCVINRAPMDVALSLQKRDEFPLGLGLRLCQLYQQGIARYAPRDALYLSYDQLLADPVQALDPLLAALSLDGSPQQLAGVVRTDLRHHGGSGLAGPLHEVSAGPVDVEALAVAINEQYPLEHTLADLADRLVNRGEEITRIGSAHSAALATLDERDADLDTLSEEHRHALATITERDQQIGALGDHLSAALATIEERDQQIAEFDRRLAQIGEEHSYALALIQSRDEQLQRVFSKPAIGLMFKAMWQHEQG